MSTQAGPTFRPYCGYMAEFAPDPMVSTEDAIEVDAETAAAIDRGIAAADEGRTLSSQEVRKLIPLWISKFSTQNQR
jgi:predicted transcriptional regulator